MLLCITGIDGCGKTVQINLLAEVIRSLGKSVHVSKAYTEQLKGTIAGWLQAWDETAITFLFQALHAQQRAEAEQFLSRGHIVLADRWDESFLAYHHLFGELSQNNSLRVALNEMAFRGMTPDITFLLQLDVAEAQRRRESRAQADVFDRRDTEYFARIQSEYLRLASEKSWVVVDASRTVTAIHNEIVQTLRPLLA